VRQAASFDFAILILTPDDAVTSRDAESFGPRDNVIFELGLFIGTLGRSRTFLLHQADSALKIPSDLAGVTTGAFAWPRDDGSRKSALGASIDTIRDEIERQGVSSKATRLELERLEDRLAQFETQLIQQILPFLIPQPMLKHLEALERSEAGKPKPADEYRGNEHLRGQLRTLRDLRLIEVASGRAGISSIPDGRFDLAAYVHMTPRGREWMQRARPST
jgi:hypothetical protein